MGQDLTKLTPDELKARQIKEMDAEMKQKLQRGANYNMKVVIKGDKNTGKTCLWRRLQRMTFVEDYRSTEQIQIATIAWDYKATSDKIKVEVWDVVDKASKRKESGNLKIGIQGEDGLDVDLSDDDDEERKTPNLPATAPGVNPQGSFAVDKLDAETVNVYKNCHAVLFLMDPRKKWTFDYIERELPNVPKSTFVLILVNYKDVPQNQRVISEYEMQEFARNAGKFVRCLECSMRNCYGMKGIRCFFNLPFLKLKRQYIIQQLKENEADLDAADQELDLVNSEQNYDFYLKWLEENRKNVKATAQLTSALPDGPPPRAAIESSKGTEVNAASLADDPKLQNRSRSASVPQNPAAGGPARQPTTPAKQPPAPVANTAVRGGVGSGGFGSYSHALPKSTASQPSTTQTPAAAARPAQPPQPTTPQRAPTAAAAPPAQAAPAEGGGLMSWTSKLFSSSAAASPAKPATPKREVRDVVADLQKLAKDPAARSAQTPTSVEDFVPPTEGGGDDFWGGGDDDDDDDDDEQKANANNGDSDDEGGRSLIAKDEDLDDDDDDEEEEEELSPAAAKAKAKREREEREKREREREQKERELKEKERQRKEREERERRERERAQAEALRRQFEQQEAAAAAAAAAASAAKPGGGGDYEQVSDDDDDDGSDDVTADIKSKPSAALPNGHKPAEKPKKKEKSIWGTKEEDSDDDDDDDDDDNEAWGLPPKNKKDGDKSAAAAAAAKKKSKSNPFIVTNDEDLPSDDDDEKPAPKPSVTSASMGVLPSATTSVSEKERRREEKEREREARRKRRDISGSYGDLADASTRGESSGTPEGERKERKSRHRHRERGDEATPEGERRERKSRHRHRGEGETGSGSGSGERESRRSSRSKRSHHRSRSASPTPPS